MHSDDNSDKLIMRLRIRDIQEEEDNIDKETTVMYLKEIMHNILNEVTICGIPEISNVTFMQYNETDYDPVTGGKVRQQWGAAKSWFI